LKAAAADDPYRSMLRGAVLPTAATTALAVGVATAVAGVPALVGAGLGAALVAVFFGLSLLVLAAVRNIAPELLLGVALALYGAKVLVLGAAVLSLREATWLSPTAFAASAMACAVAWLAGQVRGFTRMRVLVADPAARP
jgi:ATP synthase protein I